MVSGCFRGGRGVSGVLRHDRVILDGTVPLLVRYCTYSTCEVRKIKGIIRAPGAPLRTTRVRQGGSEQTEHNVAGLAFEMGMRWDETLSTVLSWTRMACPAGWNLGKGPQAQGRRGSWACSGRAQDKKSWNAYIEAFAVGGVRSKSWKAW